MPRYVVAAATAVARACKEAPADASVCCTLCSSLETLAFARTCGVALAGWLLEYPVCYTLEQDSQPLELVLAKSTKEARAAWENADIWSPMTTNLGNESLLLVRATLQVAQEQSTNSLFPYVAPSCTALLTLQPRGDGFLHPRSDTPRVKARRPRAEKDSADAGGAPASGGGGAAGHLASATCLVCAAHPPC